MTALQMKYEFEVGYDRITNFDAPGYTNKEMSTFLTKAQEELVLELYRNGNHTKEDFKKSLNLLKKKTAVSTVVAGNYPNSFSIDLPAQVLVVLNERVDILTSSTHFYRNKPILDVAVKPIDDDYYHANKQNPYKKPSLKKIWRVDDSDLTRRHIYIIPELCSITNVHLHFYKKPTPIIIQDSSYVVGDGSIDGENWSAYTATSLECVLDSLVHREIVDRAVKLAYAAVQDEKGYQISTAQEQEKK